jgi:hypothetical protein
MEATFTPTCASPRSRYSVGRCGAPATNAVESRSVFGNEIILKPICRKHAGFIKRRKYGKAEIGDITPELLHEWEREAENEAKQKAEDAAVEKHKAEIRRKLEIERATEEDAQDWEVVYEPREDIDWDRWRGDHTATVSIPKWVVRPIETSATPGYHNTYGVELKIEKDMPPKIEVRVSSEITPKAALALADALLAAAAQAGK